MRGCLHYYLRNEEGVDAGGLSAEFFGIYKEISNLTMPSEQTKTAAPFANRTAV
jgi:hypothetical protein